jgi:hypothetical protein
MQGYNFTEQLRIMLMRAREEAAGRGHQFVAPEHLLLALAQATDGVAVAVLSHFRIERADIEREVTARWPPTARATGPDLPYTSNAKRVLELAMAAAADLGHSYVGSEHMLLGLIEGKTIAAEALAALGLTAAAARRQTLVLLHEDPDRQPNVAERRWRADSTAPPTHRLARFLHGLDADTTPVTFFARLIQNDGGAHHLLELLGVDVAALEWEIAQQEWIGGSIPDLLAAADVEKRYLHDPATGTQHVLLAFLARHPEHTYASLNQRGVTYTRVRALAETIFG